MVFRLLRPSRATTTSCPPTARAAATATATATMRRGLHRQQPAPGGVNVLFADGSVRFIKIEHQPPDLVGTGIAQEEARSSSRTVTR